MFHLDDKIGFAQGHDVDAVRGICKGTQILTCDGAIPVQYLEPGDRIITRDAGVVDLRSVTISRRAIAPVRVRAGSLGHDRPEADTLLTPNTRVNIRDWRAQALFGMSSALIPVARLIDGEYIAQLDLRRVTIFALAFDREHVIYADGLEVAA